MNDNKKTIDVQAEVTKPMMTDQKPLTTGEKIGLKTGEVVGTGVAFTVDTAKDAAVGIKNFAQRKAAEWKAAREAKKAKDALMQKLYDEHMGNKA